MAPIATVLFPPACRVAVVCVSETVMAEIVMVVAPDFDASATDVALIVTTKSLGGGAVGDV